MIVNFKFFYEKTDTNYDEHHDLPLSKQTSSIINDITDNKDILAIRFCSYRTITHNIIVNNVMLGRGFVYADKIWYPKEVWIYNPINE